MTIARLVVLAVLITASAAFAQSAGEYAHEFIFKPTNNPTKVSVAGDFNNWSQDANPMTRADDGTWHAKLNLSEGVHQYKLVVDGQWTTDPAGDKSLESDDNYGGKNSGVMVGPDVRKAPPPKPDAINAQYLFFKPEAGDADVVSPHLLRLRFRAQAGDVESVVVQINAEGKPAKTQAMHKIGAANGLDIFATLVQIDAPQVSYDFVLQDKQFATHYGPDAGNTAGKFTVEMKPKFETPDWAKSAVWYQIFPERFRNGDASNDPQEHDYERVVPWTGNWWKAQPGETPGDENFYKGTGNVWKRRYGGDVQGLIESLPYLKKLGINAIYLNPMFEADSMHKYDTTDYRHIDDNFGFKGDLAAQHGETDDPKTWKWSKSDKLFLDFVRQAHEQGFKVILDGVFNHVGRSNWAFQDVLKNGKQSKYADWFDVRDWNQPIKYIAWDRGSEPSDDGALPVFKKDDKLGLVHGPREHIFAITQRWLAPDGDPSKGVDGFRLDVPGDIPHPFWVEWRKIVKTAKPDAYISGEVWTWAQPWLKGDEFDAVMNYRWADAAQKFFVNQKPAMKPSEFNQYLSEIAYNYPFQVSLVQQNLFDSHDTDRFASMFVNPDLVYDATNRLQDNGPKYKADKPTPEMYQRMRQAVACQMGFVGAPMIYYGDEAGMWSPDDPSNRQPMTWPEMKFDDPKVGFDREQFQFYQRAIAAREKLKPLQLGFFHPIAMDDSAGVYAFQRDLGDEHAYVVLNRSAQERTVKVAVAEKDGKLVNWLDEKQAAMVQSGNDRPKLEAVKDSAIQDGGISITLKPYESAILGKAR